MCDETRKPVGERNASLTHAVSLGLGGWDAGVSTCIVHVHWNRSEGAHRDRDRCAAPVSLRSGVVAVWELMWLHVRVVARVGVVVGSECVGTERGVFGMARLRETEGKG